MRPAPTEVVGVVCDDRSDMQRTVGAVLERCGVTMVDAVGDLAALLDVAGRAAPDVAVLALPVHGSGGLDAVTALRKAAPYCQVVVLTPFEGLELSARAVGARALVGEEDLRVLASVLRAVVEDLKRSRAAAPPAQGTSAPAEASTRVAGCSGSVSRNPAS